MLIPSVTIFGMYAVYTPILLFRALSIAFIIAVIVNMACDVVMQNNLSIQIVIQWVVINKYEVTKSRSLF